MLVLDDRQAAGVRAVCEVLVPGSARVGPEVYIDALLGRMAPEEREATLDAFRALAPAAASGTEAISEHAFTPDFMLARALACEAFYSDFVAPGAAGPGAWEEIDFRPPLAARLDKDWSYLGVGG
jgi:hypothetical protein